MLNGKLQFLYSDTEEILYQLTEEFNNDELCESKINPNLAKPINEVWGKKLKLEKFKIKTK